MPSRKTSPDRRNSIYGICMCLGLALGAGIGAATRNLAVGIGCGVILGGGIGTLLVNAGWVD